MTELISSLYSVGSLAMSSAASSGAFGLVPSVFAGTGALAFAIYKFLTRNTSEASATKQLHVHATDVPGEHGHVRPYLSFQSNFQMDMTGQQKSEFERVYESLSGSNRNSKAFTMGINDKLPGVSVSGTVWSAPQKMARAQLGSQERGFKFVGNAY